MTLILNPSKCAIPNCEGIAFCLYHGIFVCGRCLEKAHKRDQANKIKELMEIRE